MRLAPPDCTNVADVFYLPPELRRELLLLIAEQGPEGIDEFVRRHEKDDSTLARRLARIRERLLAEGEELRRRLHSGYDERRRAEEERLKKVMARLRSEERELAEQDARLGTQLPDDIARHVRSLPLMEIAMGKTPRRGWLQRAWLWLKNVVFRFWLWVLALFGKRRGSKGKAKGIVVGVPGVQGPGIELDVDVEAALRSNPKFRRQVRKSLGDTWRVRARRMWRIMLGLDDYAEVARKVMEDEAKRGAQDRAQDRERDRQQLRDQLTAKKEAEAKETSQSDDELRRLVALEAEEEAKLKETLAARPARDVRDLVVDELEAGGFVQRAGADLQVTNRFLENVAALVYAEESRGIGASNESPIGSTIEGEGILERTPLLSHDETSHMDVATSLLNARTRHPHVRHLLEEDVVVYRERRSSLTHVVLVLDKSLSMEENDRMAAGKRAVLALYWGVKKRNPQNKIDVILMDTSVNRVNLDQAWACEPGGFTNTGRALEAARALLDGSKASRRLLFFVTDGLPEALTIDGKDVAGRPDESMKFALRHAHALRRVRNLDTVFVLLEPEDDLFRDAGQKLADAAGGTLVEASPQELTKSLLVEMRQREREVPIAAA